MSRYNRPNRAQIGTKLTPRIASVAGVELWRDSPRTATLHGSRTYFPPTTEPGSASGYLSDEKPRSYLSAPGTPRLWIGTRQLLSIRVDTAAAYTLGTKHSLSSEKLGGGKDSFQWILYYIKSPKQDAKSRAQIKHMEHGFINPRPVTARRFNSGSRTFESTWPSSSRSCQQAPR